MDDFSAPAGVLTLADFLDRFSEVETESNGYAVACPAHEDTKPSLRVAYNPESKKIALKCRAGCKTADVVTALDLTMADLFNVDPGHLADLRSAGGVPEKPSVGDRAALKAYLDRAARAAAEPAIEYAQRRFGIAPAKFIDLGLGYDDGTVDGGNLILSKALFHDCPRLVVPLNDFDGHPHYFQGRALGGLGVRAKWSGPNNPDGAAWGKYGYFEGGTGWAEVLIAEGPGDALTAAAVGYDTVFIRGAALGTNADIADEIAAGVRGRRVVVAGDADTAGQKFTRDVAAALSERGVEVARLVIPPAAGSDLTDWRENAGPAFDKAFVRAVQEAPRYGSDQITVEEISQDLTRLFSDVYNARTLLAVIREQGGDVRYTKGAGFIVYRPEIGVWERDDAEWTRSQAQTVAARVQKAILTAMQTMDARVATIADTEARDQVGKTLDAQRRKARSGALVSYVMSTRGIDSMLRELRALPGVFAQFDDFDQHPHLLAARNGVIDLETGDLIPFSEETKDLYLMQRVNLPYVKGAQNPRWERFIEEIFATYPDTDEGRHAGLPAFMQRLIGYGVTGHTTEQCLAVFYGGGSNGKSVLMDALTGLFKGITKVTPFSTFEQKPKGGINNDQASLKGSRLVMSSEGEQGKPMAESVLKELTGSGAITARFLYQEEFTFTPTFLVLLASNYKPTFRGQDHGLWRRVKLVPFARTFTAAERDAHLTSKFLGRRVPRAAHRQADDFGDGPAGILAWAVRGAVAWHQVGLAAPRVVIEATEEYRETSDNLKEFYNEFLVKDPDGRIAGKEVWELYQRWCEEENLEHRERWRRATFWAALEERGAIKTMPQGSVAFKGIRRRRPSEALPDESVKPSAPRRVTDAGCTDIEGDGGIEVPGLDEFLP